MAITTASGSRAAISCSALISQLKKSGFVSPVALRATVSTSSSPGFAWSVMRCPRNSASESPVTSTSSGLPGVGCRHFGATSSFGTRRFRISAEPLSSSVPSPVFDSCPKARSSPSRGSCSPMKPVTSSSGLPTASTIERVGPSSMPSPARTIASELSSDATTSAIRTMPSTRPAGSVRSLFRFGSTDQNWK